MLPEPPAPPLEVAVSDCLLGSPVRWDGGHKRSSLCHERFDGVFRFRGICPEVGIGMGVPREPIRLVGDPARPRAVGFGDAATDVTDRLQAFAHTTSARLRDVDGYIFIEGSPSCGLFGVKVHSGATGRGVYAAELTRRLPDLPVEENGRLENDAVRHAFVTQVFVHAHWRRCVAAGITTTSLLAFHRRYEHLLAGHREIEHLLADPSDPGTASRRYFALLMASLRCYAEGSDPSA